MAFGALFPYISWVSQEVCVPQAASRLLIVAGGVSGVRGAARCQQEVPNWESVQTNDRLNHRSPV